jgi:ATP-dependent helicase HrpA
LSAPAPRPPARRANPDVSEIPWMIGELRISLFAQEVSTPYQVSDVRLYKAMDALR